MKQSKRAADYWAQSAVRFTRYALLGLQCMPNVSELSTTAGRNAESE